MTSQKDFIEILVFPDVIQTMPYATTEGLPQEALAHGKDLGKQGNSSKFNWLHTGPYQHADPQKPEVPLMQLPAPKPAVLISPELLKLCADPFLLR
ncbi:hypothetical protein RSAG8_13214, partial [Rhizoctonia solani AG-8 WAC10335]